MAIEDTGFFFLDVFGFYSLSFDVHKKKSSDKIFWIFNLLQGFIFVGQCRYIAIKKLLSASWAELAQFIIRSFLILKSSE